MTFGSLGPSNFLPHGWVFLFLAGCWMRSPCEDIMGTNWLRVAAWMVASASVVGNLAVIIVLSSSRSTMVVSKFLMINLATADLFMGIYLFLIAGMDLHSSGVYFNYANDWQNGKIQNRYHTEDATKKKEKEITVNKEIWSIRWWWLRCQFWTHQNKLTGFENVQRNE